MLRRALILPLLLAACGPVVAFDREGVSVAKLSQDLRSCAARANAAAPPDVQVITTYERQFRSGRWGGRPGWRFERERDIVDVNERPRAAELQRCMTEAGYRVTQLPRCSSAPAGLSGETRQPPVTEQSCVVTLDGVGPVIVTP